jgi:uncharacterized protein (DUF4415 family)
MPLIRRSTAYLSMKLISVFSDDFARLIAALDHSREKLTRTFAMRDNYDFTDSVKNPYTKKLKKQVTIRLDEDTINYFKELAEDKGLPYQSLINLYLRDCAQSHRDLKWE